MKQNKKTVRDPYYYWKIVNMVLAGIVLLLVLFVLLDERGGYLISVTYFLGALMCAFSGIMELAKGKKVVGYLSSVSAGILAVALLFSIIRMWVKV